jgi:hypothetical protein
LKCLECHTPGYAATTHGRFSASGVGGAPVPGSGNLVSLGGAVEPADEIFVTLGYGTGLRETLKTFPNGSASITGLASVSATSYIGVIAGLENFWSVKAGGVNVFDKWEYPLDATEPDYEAYCGGNCHNLGYTKMAPNANTKGAGTAATWQGWASAWSNPLYGGSDTTQTQYDLRSVSGGTGIAAPAAAMYGAGIQCENCHGTGTAADVSVGGHWNSGVKINSTGSSLSAIDYKPSAAEARPLLRSDVCGSCHSSSKSGSNWLGYTPDKSFYQFAGVQIGAAEIPTEEQYAADVAAYMANPSTYNKTGSATWGSLTYKQLWPGGINNGFMAEKPDGSFYQAGMKHVYYTEWALTGHSYRSKLTSASPDASMYQKSTTMNGLGGGGLSNASSAYRDSRCGYCHAGEVYLKDRKNDPMAAGFSGLNADVGYLGVECSSCHVVHNAGTEKDGAVGMALREPEPGNITICEDCHKDRRGVIGDPVIPLVYSGITGRGPHAAQGTVLHGQGMYDHGLHVQRRLREVPHAGDARRLPQRRSDPLRGPLLQALLARDEDRRAGNVRLAAVAGLLLAVPSGPEPG